MLSPRAFDKDTPLSAVIHGDHCLEQVIKLSTTLQNFAEEKETVANVNGVRDSFFMVGAQRAQAAARGEKFEAGNRYGFTGCLWLVRVRVLCACLSVHRWM